MTLRQRIDDWGGRKWTFAVAVSVAAFAFRAAGWLTESGMVTLVLAAMGIFATGNVVQKATAKEVPSAAATP